MTVPFTSDQIDIKNERKSLTSVNLSKSQNADQIEAVQSVKLGDVRQATRDPSVVQTNENVPQTILRVDDTDHQVMPMSTNQVGVETV